MLTKEYFKDYEVQSSIQKKVSDWDDGPLLVLAGPGSGKTRVLTCRIARLLGSSLDENYRVLGLTFTNKAADEMRTRVSNYVTGQENRLFLGTFHSFCADVLRQHGSHLGINPNYQIYSQEADQNAVLSDVIDRLIQENDIITVFDKKTLPIIQRLKTLLVDYDNCNKAIRDSELAKRMAIIYPAYDQELRKRNALDFDTLIFMTYQLFKKYPAFSKRYRTVYKYICIDEFQDTNFAQYALIRALTEDKYSNLFIVADDDQIIYQWNGASHQRLEQFISDYSSEIIQLPMNYRCPAEVIEITNNLIRHNFLRSSGKKPLVAAKPELNDSVVRLLGPYNTFQDEASAIAKDILNLHSNKLGLVTVIARNRKLLEGVFTALTNSGIKSVLSQRKDNFVSTPLIWLQSVLKLANEKYDFKSLEALSGTFNQISQIYIDPEEVINVSQNTNISYLQNWITVAKQVIQRPKEKEIISVLSKFLIDKDIETFTNRALHWFDELSSETEIQGYTEEKESWFELKRDINASLGENLTLESFLQELQLHSKEAKPKPNSVILMTVHGSKGKEFDHVYLVGLVEDEMPSYQSIKKGDDSPEMEEERRNCFVAITRAIKTLTISYAEKYNGWRKHPSRFLYEMGLLKEID